MDFKDLRTKYARYCDLMRLKKHHINEVKPEFMEETNIEYKITKFVYYLQLKSESDELNQLENEISQLENEFMSYIKEYEKTLTDKN